MSCHLTLWDGAFENQPFGTRLQNSPYSEENDLDMRDFLWMCQFPEFITRW